MLTSIEKSKTIIIYDLSNLAYCCYYAAKYGQNKNIDKEDWTEPKASKVMEYALTKALSQISKMNLDKYSIVFCVDNYPQHKYDILPEYKSGRERPDLDVRPKLIKLLKRTGCYIAEHEAQEADDVMASIKDKYETKEIVIVSSDQDLLQLCDKRVRVYNLVQNEFVKKDLLNNKYGINKWKSIIIHKALFGDASDSIPSALPRVKKETITCLIDGCKNLKELRKAVKKSDCSPRTKELFEKNYKQIKTNHTIVKLNHKLDFTISRGSSNKKDLVKLLSNYKMDGLKSRLMMLMKKE